MESLLKNLLEAGPIGLLTVASLLLNVGLLVFIKKLWDVTFTLAREAVTAIALSTEATRASSSSSDEVVDLIQENHLGLMLALAKLEKLLALSQAGRGVNARTDT